MKAKEFISELNMSPGKLMQFAFSSPVVQNMRAGFEAELIVPGSYDDGGDDSEYDWDKDSTLPRNIDLEDIRDFFELGRNDRNLEKLESDYLEWVSEKAAESIEEDLADRILYLQEKDSELDDDSASDQAWDELHDEYYQSSMPDLYDFCKENSYATWSDLSLDYSFDWPYFMENNFNDEASAYASSLGVTVGAAVSVSNDYHGNVKEFSKGLWYIEPDESIIPEDSDYMGIEVVSPPMNLIAMLNKLEKTLLWAQGCNAKTNESTGLHVGISMSGQSTQNLDYIKLILFLGDKYILDRFGRASNTYTSSSMDLLKKTVAYGGKETMLGAIDQLKRGLALEASKSILSSSGKHVSINVRQDYVEFRSMGNDYLDHFDAIQNTILRYIRAFAVASDPMAERQEYFKKLSKMLNPSNNDQLVPFVRYAMGVINKDALVKTLKSQAEIKGKVLKAAPPIPNQTLPTPEDDF